MGKKRNKAGKAKKRRRRRRQPLAGDRNFRQYKSRERDRERRGTQDIFPKELMELLND